MPVYRFDPRQGWAADSWGRIGRNDFQLGANGRTGLWGIPGENTQGDPIFDTPDQAAGAGQYFTSQAAAAQAAGAGLPGPSDSQRAYSASLQAQGIPESELPYNSGQKATLRALAARGLPGQAYLGQWAKGANPWADIAGSLLGNNASVLSKVFSGKDRGKISMDDQKQQLIQWLLQNYGG